MLAPKVYAKHRSRLIQIDRTTSPNQKKQTHLSNK